MRTRQIDLAGGIPAARAHTGRRTRRFASFGGALLLLMTGAGAHVRADAGAIGTVGLTAGWATFGEAVPQGAAVAGLQVGDLATQTDVKTRWPDGSIRFAVVSVNVPADGSYPVHAGPAAAGAFVPALPTASVNFTIGGVHYAANLPGVPAGDAWLSGPLVHEGRSVVAPISAADGSVHPSLRVNFDTRVYHDGRARVDVSVENLLDQPGATTATYDVAININGGTAFSQAGVEHYYLTRWRKAFAVGTTVLSAVTPDLTPFNLSKALPPYLALVSDRIDDVDAANYGILGAGALNPEMPAHGGRAELAPYPDWTARYLVHKNPVQLQMVLANGDLSGSWPIHVREPEGSATPGVGPERLMSLEQRPKLWFDARAEGGTMEDGSSIDYVKGTPLPMREYGSGVPDPGQSPLTPDTAHQPSIAYVPYLLTGDRYYAEEMAFWANYSMLRTYPANGVRGSGGILESNEVRGYAWALRNMVDAAAYYPDSPVRDYLTRKVEANLQWLDAYANAQDPVTNPFRILWTWYRPEPGFISIWEQNYLAYALDRATKQGFAGGVAHRDAIARLQLRLFTSEPEYPRSWGAPYLLGVATTPDPNSWEGYTIFTTWAEITAATINNPDLQRDFAGYYGPEARLNLMIGVEGGWAGAQDAYDYLWPFIGVTNSYCASATGSEVPDLTCRAGWALDFTPAYSTPAPAAAAAMVTPAPGSTLTSDHQTFTWSAGTGVSMYRLDAGNTAGATDIHAGAEVTAQSELVTGLPTDGRTIRVRLSSKIDGVWQFADYSYTAFTAATDPEPETNHKPVLAPIANQSGVEGDTVSLAVSASDPDHDTLTFSATGLPAGLSIDAATGLITGQLADAHLYAVRVFASDGHLRASWAFTWKVKKPAAVITGLVNPGPQTDVEEELVSLRIGVQQSGGSLHEQQELRWHPGTFTAANLPPGLTISPERGRIHGRIAPHSANSYAVQVTLTHNGRPFTTSFTWTVTRKNHKPDVANVPSQTSFELASISLAVSASDPDGDALTFSATGLPPGLTMGAGGVIGGTIAAGAAGEYDVTVRASDGSLSDTDWFHWKVSRRNRAPRLTSIASQTSFELAAISLATTASDPDGDALTFSATGLPPGLRMGSGGGITGTILAGAAGEYDVVVKVSDGSLSDSYPFHWKVSRRNRAPRLTSIPSQASYELAAISLATPASDQDGDALTFTATGLPPGLSMAPNGVIVGTLRAGSAGEYDVVVTVSDGSMSDYDPFHWKVTRRNRPPTVTAPAALTSVEGASITVAIDASDPDNDALEFAAVGLPNGLRITTAGIITGKISDYTAGTYTVKIYVYDEQYQDTATWKLKVEKKPVKK